MRPKVGVGVVVIKEGKILVGKRLNAHGEGTWSFPGGHLEFNEQVEDCAKRESLEEAGIKIKNLRIGPYTNDFHIKEEKHYITLYVISEYDSGEVKVMEPDKMIEWNWFSWDKLPQPMFLACQNLIDSGFNPFGE